MRERCIVGVKHHPFELSKNYKDTEKGDGGRENRGKRSGGKDVRRDRNGQSKYSNRRQDCDARIGSVFIQILNHTWPDKVVEKRGYYLKCDPFFFLEYYRKACIKSRKKFEN